MNQERIDFAKQILTELLTRAILDSIDTIEEDNLPLINKKLTQLREERENLKQRLAASPAKPASDEDYQKKLKSLLADAQRVLEQGTPGEIKELLGCFIYRIELNPAENRGRIIYYASPDPSRNESSIQVERVNDSSRAT